MMNSVGVQGAFAPPHAGPLERPFFFFQAEDGRRDVAVTGVQTCALPISSSAAYAHCGSIKSSKAKMHANGFALRFAFINLPFMEPFRTSAIPTAARLQKPPPSR